ncbi:F-box/LRR-repeat protein [Actinidia chinensis var. chinensis]|uniref:F-box/LRR-repeat protein n=1 Tax=Actinidia chinensis var. chinensis TaxID=1590841 RepID=A0A2R6R304_ACTCC|nr:F-box/LRR-repeat protein [Actinidia chinensis var. chinensis]
MDSPPILSLLTEDLLVRVLANLSDDSDRKSFRSACRSFLRVDSLHRTTFRILRPEFLHGLLRKYRAVEAIDLSVCPRIDDATVSVLFGGDAAAEWTRRLRRLVLSRAVGLGWAGLGMLVRACPGLEAVDVSYCCGFGDREAAALSCAGGLRELRLDKCLGVTDVGLAKVAVGCGRLERISLKWCLEITDLGIGLLANKCPDLKHLDISFTKVTSESLQAIGTLQKLEMLALAGCGLVDDIGLDNLGNGCPSLQVLDVSRCDKISSSGLISVIRGHSGLRQLYASYCFFELSTTLLYSLTELKNLKTISVDGAQVSGSSFHMICTNCKFLVEIGMSKCKGVTDTGLIQLASACPNLKILNLTCCDSITDAAISAITESCRNLSCLKAESCNLLTEKSLDVLGSRSLLLKDLDLTDCSGVNDAGLNYLSECSELLCLKLGLCANISDKGLSYIASNCTKICELDLYRCTGIGDDGLAALSSGCKKLKRLNLSYCNEVTDRGLQFLGHLKELSDLELRGLVNITGTGLAALAAGCRRLSELDLKNCENINDSGFWALAYYSRNLRQINLSCCAISDVGLCMVMGNLTRLQDAKLVNLPNVSVQGLELALRACCVRLKKVKLLTYLGFLLSPEILNTLTARGCRVRWD